MAVRARMISSSPASFKILQWCSHGGDRPLAETLPPFAPQMKLHFVQRSMESRHFESQSASLLTPEPPLPPPHFEKSGYAPEILHGFYPGQKPTLP